MVSSLASVTSTVLLPMGRCLTCCRQDFFLKYLASTWAVVLIIGPFFGGHLRPEDTLHGRAAMLSNMRYHTSVIIALFSALGVLGSSGKKLMRLGAYADRIADTERAVRAIAHSTDEGGDGLSMSFGAAAEPA